MITQYFNQVTHGCQNVNCTNQNCASSSTFIHSGLSSNQAAIVAIQLMISRATLCSSFCTNMDYSQNENCDNSTNDVPSLVIDDNGLSICSQNINEDISDVMDTELTQTNTDSIELTSTRANTEPTTNESSHQFLSTPDVARLIMFLYNESTNDDLVVSNSQACNPVGSGLDTSVNSPLRNRNILFGMHIFVFVYKC